MKREMIPTFAELERHRELVPEINPAAVIAMLSIKDASEEIQEHIKNGGNIMEILDAVMEAMNDSGFFNGQNNKAARIPQDHKRPKNRQRNNRGKNTHPSQS